MFLKVTATTRVNLTTADLIEIKKDHIRLYWQRHALIDGKKIAGIAYDACLEDEGDMELTIDPSFANYDKLLIWIESNTL